MPSSAISYLKMRVQVSLDGGATYNQLTEQRSASIRMTAEQADVTNVSTSIDGNGIGWRERKAILNDFEATVNGHFLEDAYSTAILNAWRLHGTLYFRFMPEVGAGKLVILGPCSVADVSIEASEGDVQRVNYRLNSAGAMTVTTQSA